MLDEQPHEPDIAALPRAREVHSVPFVTNIAGAMIALDDAGRQVGCEDALPEIDTCRRHYDEVGRGERHVGAFAG